MTGKTDAKGSTGEGGHVIVNWTEYGSVPVAIVDAIAEAIDRQSVEVPPLQEKIDADALEGIFGSENLEDDVCLSFTHETVRVVVSGDGTVVARPTYP